LAVEIRCELHSPGGDVVTGYRTVERRVKIPETKSRCEDVIKLDLRIIDCGGVVVTATGCLFLTTGRAVRPSRPES
jgi:hypothetical protein